jgi:hypothetical protein
MQRTTLIRRASMVVLAGIIALAGWDMLRAESDPYARAEQALEQRVGEYVELRKENDWHRLYDMTDPRQRRVVPIKEFFNFYDHELLKLSSIEVGDTHVDLAAKRALVDMVVVATLDVEALPAQLRRGFHEEHPEHMEKRMEFELRWTWFGDQWYFLMDDEVVQGRDSLGNAVKSHGSK